ncbi:MAG: UDP-glucose--hexose-1-phosphate uridylyltransferase [Candidatus Eremiobacteraeota bacterium]|nr:UDP-glucose--hexose-1-phosphate uridylyltransferase [Candidatus Eremiobacteraeota bacterium]
MADVLDAQPGPSLQALAERPHRRHNPLTGEWVLVSPHRTQRPWQGQVETPATADRPTYDPSCYLCPGNVRANGERNPDYTGTFVFTNDYAALVPASADTPTEPVVLDATHLLRAAAETGTCRVICFSPRHDLTLATLGTPAVRRVVDVWAEQTAELGARPDIGHVQLFENRGEMMGASNPHPHGQLWAQQHIPWHAAAELARQADYHVRHGRPLLADYLAVEERLGERVVLANDEWVALVPFWAVWPFETLVLPRRPVASVPALDDRARDGLADVLSRLTGTYNRVFNVSFPYSMGVHQAPTDGAARPECTLHLHFYPPLLRSATVRKFLVGYEMLGEPQRDLTPESAAERLRTLAA